MVLTDVVHLKDEILLRQLGLPNDHPRGGKTCRLLLDEALECDGGINATASQKRSETCLTGLVLGLLSWFKVADARREHLVAYLLGQQMDDGGWNCQRDRGAVHSSFHTTINVLEGLRDYVEASGPRAKEARRAEVRGREFFLQHHLYRSHRTGRIVNPAFTRFSFPPRWHHDILRTLNYFQASKATYDERLDYLWWSVQRYLSLHGQWNILDCH